MQVVPRQVLAQVGEKAVLKLVLAAHEKSEKVKYKGCQALRPDGEVVQLDGEGPSTADRAADDSVRNVTRLDQGLCGAQLGDLQASHNGTWKLMALTEGGSVRNATSTVLVRGNVSMSW